MEWKSSGDQGDEEASAMYPMLYTSLSSLELPGLRVRATASGRGGTGYSIWAMLMAEPSRIKEGKSQLEPLTSDSVGVWSVALGTVPPGDTVLLCHTQGCI